MSDALKMDYDIASFTGITACDPQVARGFLEMSGGNLEAALQLFFENPELISSFGAAGSASAPAAGSASDTNRAAAASGSGARDRPIQIDSDDDGDYNMVDEDDDDAAA